MAELTGGARAAVAQRAAAQPAEAAESLEAAVVAKVAARCLVPPRAFGSAPGCCRAAYGRAS